LVLLARTHTALDDHQLSGYGDISTVLLISSSRPRAQLVAAAARAHASRTVLPIVYDEDWDSPKDVVVQLSLQTRRLQLPPLCSPPAPCLSSLLATRDCLKQQQHSTTLGVRVCACVRNSCASSTTLQQRRTRPTRRSWSAAPALPADAAAAHRSSRYVLLATLSFHGFLVFDC
jgi:hypothetical protein